MPEGHDRGEQEPARDVLAAEAFAMPAADPVLSHQHPLRLPEDPTGIPEAHDILAAEEFAMPAPAGSGKAAGSPSALTRGMEASRRGGIIASLALLGAVVFRRRRGR